MPSSAVRTIRIAVLLVLVLALVGCDEGTRDEIAGAVGDAASEARSAIDDAQTVIEGAQSAIEDAAGNIVDDAASAATDTVTVPATATPTTDEPAPTETTAEPTAEPEPTPEETTAAPSPSPSPTDDVAVDDGEGGVPWPLVIGLAALLALLLWAFVVVWRRRQALLARRARLRDAALTDIDWLLGAAREQVASVDAAARARDVRLRQDRLTENLQQLRVDASDELLTVTTAALTTSRQLTDALIARLDDAVAGRGDHGAGLGVRDLEQQLRADRDDLARALGARPDQR